MDANLPPPLTLDLTGLPEPVVRHIVQIVEAARAGGPPPIDPAPWFISRPRPTLEESLRNLDAMAAMSSGKSLPIDFSTADIYDDHDKCESSPTPASCCDCST